MSWRTVPREGCPQWQYPTAPGSAEMCDRPLLLNDWELPAGYNPALPLASPETHMPPPVALMPLLRTNGAKLHPSRDPAVVGAFVIEPLLAGTLGELGQVQYVPVSTAPFTVGESVVGGPDAVGILGHALHGTLP